MEQYDDKFWPPVKESILKTHSDGTFSFTAEPGVFSLRGSAVGSWMQSGFGQRRLDEQL